MVMDWVNGTRLTDKSSLQAMGLDGELILLAAFCCTYALWCRSVGTKLVKTLVQCSLKQMLENGFFHADPHAGMSCSNPPQCCIAFSPVPIRALWSNMCAFVGNLLVQATGQLCYLDFGMVSYVEPEQRYSIVEAVIHMVNRDFVALTELFRSMGFIPP